MKQEIDGVGIGSNIIIFFLCNDKNASFPSKKRNRTFYWFSLNPE